MNRAFTGTMKKRLGVPRMHGDEPVAALVIRIKILCSPYAWG